MARPWLSVVLPTYNGAQHLAAALESVASQAGGGVELIAVDDASTDATPEILQAFSHRLPMRIIPLVHTGNWAANTNVGLQAAEGAWASLLHQDDAWLPGRVAALHDVVRRRPDAGLVIHPVWYVDDVGRRVGKWTCPAFSGDLVEHLLVQNFIAVPGVAFSRQAALDAGGLDASLWYTADWDLWLKLAAAATVVAHREPLAVFRLHPLSQTVARSTARGEFRAQLEEVLRRHLPAWESHHPGRGDVGRAARFSVEVNTALAAALHGDRVDWWGLCGQFLRLGPAGWRRYLRDSRLLERVVARRRAGLSAGGQRK